jgi:alkylated DNA repair dioxygenase AlkB
MSALFQIEASYPPGLSYTDDFISEEEEQQLCAAISKLQLHTFIFRGFEAKRKVESFGYDYNFNDRSISPGKAIPAEFDFLINKTAAYLNIESKDFQELLVIEYPVGSVMNWHRDAPPFELIAGISLLSDCTLKFRPYEKSKQGKGTLISLPVKRRSLYVMKDEIRNDWEHSVPKMKSVRYSITLRTLKS